MEEKLQGIVLSRVAIGDNDAILNIFTLESGTVSAKIKGVKKAGAKLKFAAEPFCFCEYVFVKTAGKRSVISASLIDSFYPVRLDMTKYFCGSTVLEYVKRFLKEEIVSADMFYNVVNSLKELAYTDKNPRGVLVKFLTEALRLSGYGLNTEGCFNCGGKLSGKVFFDYASGGFFCENCKTENAREINPSTYSAFFKILNGLEIEEGESIGAIRLLDYYLINKADENLKSIKELVKKI